MNFPGSKKAAKECLEIIESCIPHAVSLILDKKREVKKTHDFVQSSGHAGCCSTSSHQGAEGDGCEASAKNESHCHKLTSTVSIFLFFLNFILFDFPT